MKAKDQVVETVNVFSKISSSGQGDYYETIIDSFQYAAPTSLK